MRRNLPFIGLCSILVIAVFAIALALRSVDTLTPTGVWKDVDSDYYIVFSGDQFIETTYNVRRPFEKIDGGILMYDAAGEPYFVDLSKNLGGKALVNLNGVKHVMRRATESEAANPLLYIWGTPIVGKCTAAYRLKQDLNLTYYLRLYEDNVFTSIIDGEETIGKYAYSSDGNILLLTEQGTRVDSLHRWAEGAAFGELSCSVQTTEQWLSPVELLGYQLSGIIKDYDLGTEYRFTPDGICVRRQGSGDETEFLYFMSPSGLITLTDSAGSGVMDYMWYDLVGGKAYRYVLGNDDWFAYLNGDNVPDAFSVTPKDPNASSGNNSQQSLMPGQVQSDKNIIKSPTQPNSTLPDENKRPLTGDQAPGGTSSSSAVNAPSSSAASSSSASSSTGVSSSTDINSLLGGTTP